MKKLLFALSILAFGMSACHNHDEDDSVKPVLTITTPTSTGSYTTGADVKITGKVSDETSLHELSIVVTQVSDGKELFKAEPSVHDLTTYDINETWKPNVSADTPVKLTVTAEDHGSNKTEVTVNFTVKK